MRSKFQYFDWNSDRIRSELQFVRPIFWRQLVKITVLWPKSIRILDSDHFGRNVISQNLQVGCFKIPKWVFDRFFRSEFGQNDNSDGILQSKNWSKAFFDRIWRSKSQSKAFFDRFFGQNFSRNFFWPIVSPQSAEIIDYNLWQIGQNDILTTVFPTDHFRSKWSTSITKNSAKISFSFCIDKIIYECHVSCKLIPLS